MTTHLTLEQRQLARPLSAKRLSLRETRRQVGCSHEVVRTVVRRESKYPSRPDEWQPGPGRLTLADREEISLGLHCGDSLTVIAARIGKGTRTVSVKWPAMAGAAIIARGASSRTAGRVASKPDRRSPHDRPVARHREQRCLAPTG